MQDQSACVRPALGKRGAQASTKRQPSWLRYVMSESHVRPVCCLYCASVYTQAVCAQHGGEAGLHLQGCLACAPRHAQVRQADILSTKCAALLLLVRPLKTALTPHKVAVSSHVCRCCLPFQGGSMLLSQLVGAIARCEAVKAATLSWGIPLPEGRAQQSPIPLNALQDSPAQISKGRLPTGLRRVRTLLCTPAGCALQRPVC